MGVLIVITVVGVLACGLQVLLTLQTWESRRYALRRAAEPASECLDPVTLIVPCKGQELDAERHLSAFLSQDHPSFEVVFVVESAGDPAAEAIRHARTRHADVSSRLVTAGRCVESGQKVHNLIKATGILPHETTVLAFADADVCPPSDWLRHLVAGLQEPGIGAVTGYRWLVPLRDSLPNLVLYSINSALAGLLGPGRHYVVWGGAWAIRREVFEAVDIRTAWRGTLSDDLVANRALREAQLAVRFEPNCMVSTPLDCDWSAAIEFAQRQFRISRLYLSHWWAAALITGIVCQVSFWGQLYLALRFDLAFSARAAFGVAAMGQLALMLWRAKLRQDLVDIYTPDYAGRLKRARQFDRLAAPLVAVGQTLLLIGSSFGRRIRWRGISYFVSASGQSQLLARGYQPVANEPVILKFPIAAASRKPTKKRPLRRAA